MEENKDALCHDAVIRSRKRLEMTGVIDVSSFDDGQIIAGIEGVDISIEGEGLKIEKFDSDSGILIVNGKLNGLFYYGNTCQKKKRSIVGLFK